MSKTEYSFDGLDDMEKQLSQMIEQQYPAEFRQMVIELASELKDKVKENTPVDTSHLQDQWEVGDVVKQGNEYIIEVYNNTEYAEPVEYGHRKRGGKGFVEGAHMMEISLELLQQRLPDFLRDWMSDFLNKHDL